MRRRTTVLSVGFPFATVGEGAVGGAEVVLTMLERALVGRGWGSVVVARAGSRPAGELVATEVPEGMITDEVRAVVTARQQAGIDRALADGGVDLVHMHGIDFASYRVPEEVPVLVTLHLPPGWYPEGIWSRLEEERTNVRMVCVSEAQRRACPAGVRGRLGVVANGVEVFFGTEDDTERLAGSPGVLRPTHADGAVLDGAPAGTGLGKDGGYAVMLSRICPEKNLHEGIEAGRRAGVEVVLAGEVFPYEAHLRYFREEVEPRLGEGVRLMGAVGGEQKRRLLEGARCLLLPTLAPETSSLVAMEAAAAGTPVLAYGSGAVPEVVEDGVTGFLVDGVQEMAEAIGRVGEIDRGRCRRVARERFGLDRMVAGYEQVYREMLGTGL